MSAKDSRKRLSDAIDRLSGLVDDGALLAATSPDALIHAVCDALEAERGRVGSLLCEIDDWKSASGLIDSSGDPDGIAPRHLEADIAARDREAERLRGAIRLAMSNIPGIPMFDSVKREITAAMGSEVCSE